MTKPYKPRYDLRPNGLKGLSEKQIDEHWALYEGYVKNVNLLEEKLNLLSKVGNFGPEFCELKRRAGFEFNGMLLHEYYFGALKAGHHPMKESSALAKRLEECFGSVAAWRSQFEAMGHMRGTGWVILYYDPRADNLVNVWISSHEEGHPAGFTPILAMDVWEHAYMVDWGADGRAQYLEKFMLNVDWQKIERHFEEAAKAFMATLA